LEIFMATKQIKNDAQQVRSARYSPRWITYASRILDGLFDGDRSGRNDHTTRRIMLTSIKTLAKGNTLSDKQRAAFIDNIRIRLGKTGFVWDGPIKLTRSQLPAARELLAKHISPADGQRTAAGMEQDLMELVAALTARVVDLEHALAKFLQTCPGKGGSTLHNSDTHPAEIEWKAAERAGLPMLTKRNETERNHGSCMTSPFGAVDPMSIEMPAPSNDYASSTGPMENELHHKSIARRDPDPARAMISYFRNDPRRAPSANLEIGGDRFSLVFHTADYAEDKMRTSFSTEWLRQFEATLGKALRTQSRANSTTDHRYVISPFYDAGDRFGMKEPVVPNSLAVLIWSGDGIPLSVIILVDDADLTIPLAPSAQTKPKSPTYKGNVRLAA
jgi:hypothetical protein